MAGDEYQGQVRFGRAQAANHLARRLFHRRLAGERMAASRLLPAAPEPVEGIERNHELDPTNPVDLTDDRDNEPSNDPGRCPTSRLAPWCG
ncbi:hypothetical protein SynNOUM97013_00361 [Synechococcus sp. NOUM97013]|nr:hypothetical protein SynNOUM97013_00361 [Synechococcus sp. NOUM97013]